MKIEFKKEEGKSYQCFICGKQFNWGSNSRRFGKMEYKTIPEQQRDEKHFCTKEHAGIYQKMIKKHKD